MMRTQIQLTEDQAERIKRAARRQGVSMAELIRRGVDILLREEHERSTSDLARQAIAAAGRFSSASHDVSQRHDDYLAESFE